MTKKNDEQKNQTPKWLKTIQLNSWEAELLVSALVLYALFQVPDYLERSVLQNVQQGSQLHNFFSIVLRSIGFLKAGYILHIMIRGLWVASVGLSYVFPGGINKESLGFKGKFNKELDSSRSFVNNVLRLEELSSTIYGITFLLFGSMLGFGTMLFTLIFFAESLNPLVQEHSWLGAGYLIIIVVYLLSMLLLLTDFVTGGLLRSKKWAVEWFYPIAFIFRFFTLSFLYRRSLLVLMSNVKGWKSKLVPLALLILIVGSVFINRKVRDNKRELYLQGNQAVSVSNANYENLRNSDDPLFITIQSDIVKDNTLRVFLNDLGLFNSFYNDGTQKTIKWFELPVNETSEKLNTWLNVRIDSTRFSNLQWFRTQHPETYDFGLITYIDIDELARGSHNFSVSVDSVALTKRSLATFKASDYRYSYLSNIYFFYDKQ
ncbi:MAG: hypothetical protein RIM99_06950 [Cyclobacteriaceae bacterium]